MGSARTPWHRLFAAALRERAPPGFEVRAEVQLSTEPQRADIVLIRRPDAGTPGERPFLRRLWGRIRKDALLELKTVARPVRSGDLARLLGYGAQYFATTQHLANADDLLFVLLVPSGTPTLTLELARLRWSVLSSSDGYATVWGPPFPAMLVLIDDVARSERDDLLRVFGHDKIEQAETRSWLENQLFSGGDVAMRELEGYDEVLEKLAEGLSLEQRLRIARLTPEERFAGLPPEERLALLPTLPIELLRAFPEEVLAQLPAEVRSAIRRRLSGEPH